MRAYKPGKTMKVHVSRQEHRAYIEYLNDLRRPADSEPSKPISEETLMLFTALELAYEAGGKE